MSTLTITPALIAQHQLTEAEYEKIVSILNREPNYTELGIFSVMWSEHCSYKSSRLHLKKLPTRGKLVLQGPRRKRRHHRHWPGLRHRLQDRIAQPPQLHRAVSRRGDRGGRHPARHFYHGGASDRRAGFAALRPAGRFRRWSAQQAHPGRRGLRHRALRQLLSESPPSAASVFSRSVTAPIRW